MAHQPEMAEPESTKPRKTGLCVGSGGPGSFELEAGVPAIIGLW